MPVIVINLDCEIGRENILLVKSGTLFLS